MPGREYIAYAAPCRNQPSHHLSSPTFTLSVPNPQTHTHPTMMNLIAQNGKPETIRSRRFRMVLDRIALDQDALVNQLRRDLAELENRYANLVDIGPDQTTSLRVVDEKFDSQAFVRDVQALKLSIIEKKVELETAVETQEELKDRPADSPVATPPLHPLHPDDTTSDA